MGSEVKADTARSGRWEAETVANVLRRAGYSTRLPTGG
jgi:hypothetical protein